MWGRRSIRRLPAWTQFKRKLRVNRIREVSFFLITSFALAFLVFGDALWGRAILAPVDLAPALWAKFGFVDPASTGIPQNQHVVDQLSYDLPLQTLLHEAWRRGEVPWWNPYSYGGRPLLADAHCSGADPLRVAVYLAVPDFVLAYNWTRVLHWLWGSLGVFLLLRCTGLRALPAGLLALAGEIAGWKVQLFGHPWVEGALCWYPWLWLTWEGMRMRKNAINTTGAALCVAAIFFAGNIQSHVYLPLFILAVAWGWAGRSAEAWWQAVKIIAPSAIAGGLLAAPLLLAEYELFRLNARIIHTGGPQVWNAPLAFAALHPWLLGTARSGSYGTSGVGALSFALWAGSAILPLAALGLRGRAAENGNQKSLRRTSVALVVGYLCIIATPLNSFLYARYAGIPVLGLLILAAFGLIRLAAAEMPSRIFVRLTLLAALLVLVAGDFAGRFIYPHFRGKYAAKMESRAMTDGYGGRSAPLRTAQVAAVPSEISLTNPDALAGVLALAATALALRARRTPAVWNGVLAFNLVAPLLVARHFIPHQPVEMWERLRAGSTEQRQVLAHVADSGGRLEETIFSSEFRRHPEDGFSGLFPQEFSALHHIHVLHGYAALVPPNDWADVLAGAHSSADFVLRPDGTLIPGKGHRFELQGETRPLRIAKESLTHLVLTFPETSGGILRWNDSAYPGWRASDAASGKPIALHRAGRVTVIALPPGTAGIQLDYRPANMRFGMALASISALALLGAPWLRRRRKQMTASAFSL